MAGSGLRYEEEEGTGQAETLRRARSLGAGPLDQLGGVGPGVGVGRFLYVSVLFCLRWQIGIMFVIK